jgi:predicted TIM-barrel fold metal-dependent hydrolase
MPWRLSRPFVPGRSKTEGTRVSSDYLVQRKAIRTPAFRAPKDSCDCHAHIFGTEPEFPFEAERSYTPPEASQADYLKMLATIGFQRMVIVQPSVYGFDNSCTIGAIVRFGIHRARAIVQVPVDASANHLRELHAAGARGVRFITVAKGGAVLDDLQAIATKIAPLGWHLQMYLPPETWQDLVPVLARLPVPVVIDHMGQVMADRPPDDAGARTILRLLESERFWVKLSGYRVSAAGYPYADVAPWARRLVDAAPDRCVWGTDWPHPNLQNHMPDDGELVDLLAEWVPGDAQRRAILVDNPARLYGFEATGADR